MLKNLYQSLQVIWDKSPLKIILFFAILFRLIAVIFSKGWGMLDDHFLVVEVAQSWADGLDANKWLPWTPGNKGPEGHSFLYVGLHYIFFAIFKFFGLQNPQYKMYFIRAIAATWSLFTVYYGYKIAEKLSDKKSARLVGILLALYWFMPWSSVRNLVEIAAIPFLIISTWILLNASEKKHRFLQFILAGIVAGLAFSVRYQTGIYSAAMGLVLLLQKQYKPFVYFSIGNLIAVLGIQGGIDMVIWGRPFAEMGEYIQYNQANKYNYILADWYSYFLLLLGILIPPISFFLLRGMFVNIKKNLILFLPAFAFLLFHIYYPNKQERFILTIVPSLVIMGAMGWRVFYERSTFWAKNKKLYRGFILFFWTLNTIALLLFSTMYGKRSRVEAMYHLYQYPKIHEIMVENSNGERPDIMPQFYAGQRFEVVYITKEKPLENDTNKHGIVEQNSAFVLFVGAANLQKRVQNVQRFYPNLVYEKEVEPGFVDQILFKLNPSKNNNQNIYIYRNTKIFADRLN